MRKFLSTALLSLVILPGCAIRLPRVSKPAEPPVLTDKYTVAAYLADRKALEGAANPAQAKALRDRLVWNLLWTIDADFEEYAQGVASIRATGGIVSDTLQTGVAGATALVPAQRTKQILAVALMGVQGTASSANSHYFANISPQIFVAAMRQARAPLRAGIEANLQKDAAAYSFERARADLTNYFYAGTLEAAQEFLAKSANK